MTRLVALWMTCSLFALGSFAVLLAEDRRLDVPLPYSVPLAFASLMVIALALLVVVEKLRAERPVRVEVVQPAPPPVPAEAIPRPRAIALGWVLLDFSRTTPSREKAA
jgi:hypothetical protein